LTELRNRSFGTIMAPSPRLVDNLNNMSGSFPLVTLRPVTDGRGAWAALMLDAAPGDGAAIATIFGEFGLATALGPLPCVLSVAYPEAAEALPASQIMLRLPLALCCDPIRCDALHALRARGFRLMADGLPDPGQALCDSVHALSVTCSADGVPAGLDAWLARLPGPNLALGAAAGGHVGHSHFQWQTGFPPDAPHHAAGQRSADAPNRLLLLELLSQVANDADSHEIEATIKRDPQLSYYLLKLVNSVGFSLTTKITSFNQAITLLGRRQLQRWLQLLLYARTVDGGKANALLPRAAMRAGLTEALCKDGGGTRDAQDRAFMTGMFSLLDRLFGAPIGEIIGPLNLADDVCAALTHGAGPFGTLLRAVAASEDAAGNAELAASLAEAGIGNESWAHCLVSACHWAVQVSCEA
jgi:EAL and modified HD-GYP domain-containing signal transduction protein